VLPFEALTCSEPVPRGLPFRFALASKEISYVPSLSLTDLGPRAEDKVEGRRMLAIGCGGTSGSESDDFRKMLGRRFPYLANAEQEAKDVGRLFGPAARIRTGDEASESFLASAALTGYRIIHIAGHLYADETDPRRSGIFLGGGGRRGWLPVRG
jgi:CHAT domain-containing protein